MKMNPMFYFLLASTAVLAVAAEPVLDIDGDIIVDGSYYALPLQPKYRDYGLTLFPHDFRRCGFYIGKIYKEKNKGIPIRFSNWKSKVGFVPESENLNIEMDVNGTTCGDPIYWWIEGILGQRYVTSGPKPNSGDGLSWMNSFQIKKAGEKLSGYKFVVCYEEMTYCIDIKSVFNSRKEPCLGLFHSDTPFEVVFVKANGTGTLSKAMSIM